MAKRLRIGVDVDGVLVDFISAFRKEAEIVLERQFPLPDSWNCENWNTTQEEMQKVWKLVCTTPNWFLWNCPVKPFVAENLPWLVENHDVYFITARTPTAGFSVQEQIQMTLNQLGVDFPTVLVEQNKGPIAAALQLTAFVDDKIDHLIEVDNATKKSTQNFLMSLSHNEVYKIPSRWTRIKDFGEFVAKIKEME